MPPLPPVAFDVISERVGTPGPTPEPTPGPTPEPTPGPGLMSLFICTAAGAACISASSFFIASRPTPDARARAFSSFSPGGLLASGRRASTMATFGSGFGTLGVAGLASSFGTGLSSFGNGAGGGASRSSSNLASRGGNGSTAARSGSRTGNHGITSAASRQTTRTCLRMRLKRSSSSAETDHARIGVCR